MSCIMNVFIFYLNSVLNIKLHEKKTYVNIAHHRFKFNDKILFPFKSLFYSANLRSLDCIYQV